MDKDETFTKAIKHARDKKLSRAINIMYYNGWHNKLPFNTLIYSLSKINR